MILDIGADTEDEWTNALVAVLGVIGVLLQITAHLPGGPSEACRAALQDKTKEAASLVQHSVLWATRAGSGGVQPLLRISKGLDALRIIGASLLAAASCASSCAYRAPLTVVAPLLLLQGELHSAAAAASPDGGEWREESARRSVDAMLVCIHARSLAAEDAGADSAEVETLVRFIASARSQGGAMILQGLALGASGPLFNYAVAAYNAANFAQAVGPLSMACHVCTLLTDVGSLAAADVAQMAKRERMLAYCLQRTGALLPALESSARAAVLLALGADWKACTAAIHESVSLRSSLLSSTAGAAEGHDSGGAGDRCRRSVRSTLLELSGYEKELAAAGSVARFLEAELWASLSARRVAVDAVVLVCDRLLEAPAACVRGWARRGRVLLEKAKLTRACLVSASTPAADAKSRAKGGAGKAKAATAGRNKGASASSLPSTPSQDQADALATSDEALGAVLKAVAAWDKVRDKDEADGSIALLRAVVAELGGVYAWRAILLLDDGSGTGAGRSSGDALQAAVTALTVFDALSTHLCRQRERGDGAWLASLRLSGEAAQGGDAAASSTGHSWELARARAHVLLLADVFSLHGQEQLQLRALETAASLASVREDDAANDTSEHAVSRLALAVDCGLSGLPGAAARCLPASSDKPGSVGDGGPGALLWCMTLVARAAVMSAEGRAAEALALLEETQLAALASDRFRALKDRRDEIAGLYAAVKCEATAQQGRGLAAARLAVSAVHAMLNSPAGPSRLMAAVAANAASSAAAPAPGAGDEEEDTMMAARGDSGGVNMSAYGGLVCSKSGEASHFRHMHQVARALARAGELYTVMGFAREAAYYLEQGLQVAKGCGSVYWHTRFLRLLIALRLVELDVDRARQCAEEATTMIDTAMLVAQHPSDPLTFLAAERFLVDALSSRVSVEQRDAAAARRALEAARSSLASTRARASMRSSQPHVLSTFMKDVCAQTLTSSAWLIEFLSIGCAGEAPKSKGAKGIAAPAPVSSASKAQPVVDWRVKYGFKQPAPGVKSKSALAAAASVPAAKGTKPGGTGSAGGSGGGWVEEARGGLSAESGLDEMLTALESDVLVLEGRQDDALGVLGRALASADTVHLDRKLGGELQWAHVSVLSSPLPCSSVMMWTAV